MPSNDQPPPAPGAGLQDRTIVRAAIHPAIGVARVGNSDEFYIGPEVTEPEPAPAGSYKDAAGALKRQAARFRIYGYNAAGEVVSELTAENADIRWTVHIANKKAAWYQFQLALDIPEAASADPSLRRNRSVAGAARKKLVIAPAPRSIQGRDQQGVRFDDGTFLDTPVYLGELHTDGAGRLLFLGGKGRSASHDGSRATDFANNDGWYDDMSDGPVLAEVTVDGRPVPVEGAWVAVGPPNYAPDVIGIRTMYDLLFDLYVREGRLPAPARVSFARDIYPILRRFCELQWVNFGFAAQFGQGSPQHFLEPAYLSRLASSRTEDAEVRRQVFNAFRTPTPESKLPLPWPWIYGDAMNIPAASPLQHLSLSPTHYRMLELWVRGEFDSDLVGSPAPHRRLSDVPLADQPAMLDRAALSFCLADAFHPGCELTWPMRHSSMYTAPFRIRRRPPNEPEPDYGDVLTPEIALKPGGPLHAQGPGDLTRWMAVPWQTDTASCRAGYEARYDPYLPTFWPARVPNHVLTEESWRIVRDERKSREERLAAFNQRASWFRGLRGRYQEYINQMVTDFGKLGVVETREGVPNDPDLSPIMLVESPPGFDEGPLPPARSLVLLDLPEGAEDAAPARMLAEATAEILQPDEEVVAGPINKVHRLRTGS